jgi:hypothetical protein
MELMRHTILNFHSIHVNYNQSAQSAAMLSKDILTLATDRVKLSPIHGTMLCKDISKFEA